MSSGTRNDRVESAVESLMDHAAVKASIAPCGLICKLCFLASQCAGCRSTDNQCAMHHPDEGCLQRTCSAQKGFDGCWQCADLADCTQGIYSLGDYSKIKAFAACIQQDGIDTFVAYVLRNQARGLSVEKGRDYDGLPIPIVLNMLRTGNR